MQKIRRVDLNQTEIVQALRSMGIKVLILSMVGKGVPDLIVSKKDKLFFIEIKNGKLAKSAQKLTDDEAKFHAVWGKNVRVVNSVVQAIEFVNEID